MPKAKKKRPTKTSPNTAGAKRELIQASRCRVNVATRNEGGRTPWEIAKDKRKHIRILQGKHTAWMRRQAAKSNYKTEGKNKVLDQIKPGTGIAYDEKRNKYYEPAGQPMTFN